MRALLTSSYAGSPRVYRAARILAELGIDVYIAEWDRKGTLPVSERKEGIKIIRYRRRAPYGLLALPFLFSWMIWLFINILRGDYVLIQARNLDSLIPASLARFVKRFSLVYDMADFYADSHVDMPIIRRFIALIEIYLTSRVDLLLLVSPKQIEQLKGILPRRVVIFYNSPPRLSLEEGPAEVPTLVYVGTLERKRCSSLIKLMKIAHLGGYQLIIAGFGECEDIIRKLSDKFQRVTFLGRVDRRTAIELIAKSHLVVSYYDPKETFNHMINLPNKFMDAIMVGRPVMVAEGTYLSDIVKRYGVGIVVNLDSLEESIERLKSLDIHELMEMGLRGKALYDEKFSWERTREIYKKAISELLSRKGSGDF